MALKTINPSHTEAWRKLFEHKAKIEAKDLNTLFQESSDRAIDFSIEWQDFFVDFSKNLIDKRTLELLLELAEEVKLKSGINQYFEGDRINITEGRSVLHTALRAEKTDKIFVNDVDVVPAVYDAKARVRSFSNDVINGKLKGYTGKSFTDIVNIGIGGSDLGPAMIVDTLRFYKNHLNVHFVSNVDGDHVHETLKKINPETTLFLIVSKSFSTQETLTNATTVRKWFLKSANEDDIAKHFVAVSANEERVKKFGISLSNQFPMWDWVGGRFSLWSSVGLSIALAIGFDQFDDLLKGANEMDKHFKSTEFQHNIPVILALISIWYSNMMEAETEVVIPYSQYLQRLSAYLQQAIMESNGKSTDRDGNPVDYQTGNIIWGEPGTNSQHAFFQLMHQGTKLIPADFIGFKKPLYGDMDHHNKLMANFFAQTEALMTGKSRDVVRSELESNNMSEDQKELLLPFRVFEGNKPTNTLLVDKLTPKSLGKLIALYEHKIFVQGYIWNIFSYDQWGVQLGKQLASKILEDIEGDSISKHDSSTIQLLKKYKD